MNRCSARLILLVAVCAGAAASAAPPAPGKVYDWCSAVVVRPDQQRGEVAGKCVVQWPDEEIAAGARVVLIGTASDVPATNAASVPPSRCALAETHQARGRYVARLRELRAKAGGPPLRAVHMHRFDLVSATLAAEPGFRADFLVSTDRPWQQVLDFFAHDRSPACGVEGCRFTLAQGGWEDRNRGASLADWIDASGGPRRHESVVYYLVRAKEVEQHFWPTAAIADLRNPAYRAWRVAQAKRTIEIGGYDAIALNNKFHLYLEPYWIGGPRARDVAELRALGDETLWSAPPRGYGYPEYVEGWAALAHDLRAAGVPYAITTLPAWPWVRSRADDPKTRQRDEGQMIREAVEGARIVLLERHARADPSGLAKWAADLTARGVEVEWVDTACGLARPWASEAHSEP